MIGKNMEEIFSEQGFYSVALRPCRLTHDDFFDIHWTFWQWCYVNACVLPTAQI